MTKREKERALNLLGVLVEYFETPQETRERRYGAGDKLMMMTTRMLVDLVDCQPVD